MASSSCYRHQTFQELLGQECACRSSLLLQLIYIASTTFYLPNDHKTLRFYLETQPSLKSLHMFFF